MIDEHLCLPQYVHIAKRIGIVFVSAVEENDTILKFPPLGHLYASSVIATEAISICKAGLLGEGAESTPTVCEVGRPNELMGIRPKA